jgi:hypothetical protein
MSHEALMHSIQIAQRDAAEQAVIRHLESQELKEPSPQITLTDIAKAMYRAYYKQAVDLRTENPIEFLPLEPEWEFANDPVQLCWLACAAEAVAQVAAMNATAKNRLSP